MSWAELDNSNKLPAAWRWPSAVSSALSPTGTSALILTQERQALLYLVDTIREVLKKKKGDINVTPASHTWKYTF